MYSVTFNLKKPNGRKATLVNMFVFYNSDNIKVSTKQKLHPSLWDKKKRSVTKNDSTIAAFEAREAGTRERLIAIQERLNDLKQQVDRYYLECTMDESKFSLYDLKAKLSTYLDNNFRKPSIKQQVCEYLDSFIEQMDEGKRKQPGGIPYSLGTIKNYKNLLQALERYENEYHIRLSWSDIDRGFYNRFLDWHLDEGYSTNYTGKHVKDLKALMKIAFEEGVHECTEFQKRYFVVPYKKQKKVPLTFDEVKRIQNLKIKDNPNFNFSREVFLLGCYLGLRVSDIKRIKPSFIENDSSGLFLRMTTQKTDNEVKIPINSKAQDILSKYDFELPNICEQVVNRHLKVIGKKIGLPKSRAKKLTLHVSRHTFCKLSYEMGISSMFIMSISGHVSEKHFLRYINIQPDRAAQEFRKHDYFK